MPTPGKAIPRARRATTVYVLRDLHGQPLYVGITRTDRGLNRFGEHAGTKPWFTDVAKIDVTHYDDGEAAAEAERLLIRHLRPPHNIAEQPVHPHERERRFISAPSPVALRSKALDRAPLPEEVVSCLWEGGVDRSADLQRPLTGAKVFCGREGFYLHVPDARNAYVVALFIEEVMDHVYDWFCSDKVLVGVTHEPKFLIEVADGSDWDLVLAQVRADEAQAAVDLAALDAQLDGPR